jgi:hypothetical protein
VPNINHVFNQILPAFFDVSSRGRTTERIPGEKVDISRNFVDDNILIAYKCGEFHKVEEFLSRREIDQHTYLSSVSSKLADFLDKCRSHFFVARLEIQETTALTLSDRLQLRSATHLCKSPYVRRSPTRARPKGRMPRLVKFQPIRTRLDESHLDH